MQANAFMRDIVEIVSLILGLGFVALLIQNAQGTAQVISASTGGINDILQTVIQPGGGGMGPLNFG